MSSEQSSEKDKDSLWGSEPISSVGSAVASSAASSSASASSSATTATESTFSKESWDNEKDTKRAIYEFYKLKEKYEQEKEEFKDYLRKAKKNKIKKLKQNKPKCVKCGRDVGSIFIVDHKQYSAKCGDTVSPCPLNIFIQKELQVLTFSDYLAELKADIEANKQNIIKHKLNLLFGYTKESDTMKKVEEEINDFNGNNLLYENILVKYKKNTMPDERVEDLQRLHAEIEQYIGEIQFMSRGGGVTSGSSSAAATAEGNNPAPAIDTTRIAEIYVNDLLPRVKSLREKKYDVMEYENQKLYQYPIAFEKNEIVDKTDVTKIVSFFT